jgi:hypothetical protein
MRADLRGDLTEERRISVSSDCTRNASGMPPEAYQIGWILCYER